MRIVTNEVLDSKGNVYAQEVIHTERAEWNFVMHPEIPGQKMDTIDFLAYCQTHKEQQVKAGYHELGKLVRHDAAKKKWDHIAEACQTAHTDTEEYRLGLTKTDE